MDAYHDDVKREGFASILDKELQKGSVTIRSSWNGLPFLDQSTNFTCLTDNNVYLPGLHDIRRVCQMTYVKKEEIYK